MSIKDIIKKAKVNKETKKVFSYSVNPTKHAKVSEICEEQDITLNRLIEEFFNEIIETYSKNKK